MKARRLIVLLAVVATACAGGDATNATTGDPTTTTASTTTTTTSTTTTTTIPPTTTTTLSEEQLAEMEFEEDVQKIKQLWRRFSDSWAASTDAAYEYITQHNHPLKECTGEDWRDDRNLPDEYWSEIVVHEATIERDDGWPIPSGSNAGVVPDGRVYIMTVTATQGAPTLDVGEQTLEVHAAIDPDGEAYFFFDCGN